VLGLIVAANFIAVASLSQRLGFLTMFEKPVRYLASFTLSIYLFHMPLTVFIWNGLGIRSAPAVMALLMLGIFALGSITERNNKQYRSYIQKCFPSLKAARPVSGSPAAEGWTDTGHHDALNKHLDRDRMPEESGRAG
jgi:peptidoglycan/LPS O-acetylase OafA/YrhL